MAPETKRPRCPEVFVIECNDRNRNRHEYPCGLKSRRHTYHKANIGLFAEVHWLDTETTLKIFEKAAGGD